MKISKKIGFTLAEILVTLGVIGVIASMTIPNLVQDVQDAQFRTAWKKIYAELDQAAKRLTLDNAGNLKDVFNTAGGVWKSSDAMVKLGDYLKYTKKCDLPNNPTFNNCWHSQTGTKALNNGLIGTGSFDEGGAILANGAFLNFSGFATDCSYWGPSICGRMWVDVNGFKGPNMVSKDIYILYIYENTVKPYGDGTTCSGNGFDCSSYYLSH